MHEKLHKLEYIIDKLIPWMIILLLAILLGEFFFEEFIEHHHLHPWIVGGDILVIIVFIVDLVFKYIRVRNIKTFVKKFWLEILAVFPFILFFRFFEGIFTFFIAEQTLKHSQSILHESVEIEKSASKFIREAEKVHKISRTRAITRFIRPLARLPRFLKYVPRMINYLKFYEKPTGKHHHKR